MSEAQGQPAKPQPEGADIQTVARVWRCAETVVRKLARAGIAVRLKHGRYALLESTGNYIVHLREQAAGRKGKDDGPDIVTEGAMLKSAQRRLVEMNIAKQEGQLISLPELEAVWSALIAGVRQLFLSFPSRARFDLPHLTAHDQQVLNRLARDMLSELATDKPPLPSKDDGQ